MSAEHWLLPAVIQYFAGQYYFPLEAAEQWICHVCGNHLEAINVVRKSEPNWGRLYIKCPTDIDHSFRWLSNAMKPEDQFIYKGIFMPALREDHGRHFANFHRFHHAPHVDGLPPSVALPRHTGIPPAARKASSSPASSTKIQCIKCHLRRASPVCRMCQPCCNTPSEGNGSAGTAVDAGAGNVHCAGHATHNKRPKNPRVPSNPVPQADESTATVASILHGLSYPPSTAKVTTAVLKPVLVSRALPPQWGQAHQQARVTREQTLQAQREVQQRASELSRLFSVVILTSSASADTFFQDNDRVVFPGLPAQCGPQGLSTIIPDWPPNVLKELATLFHIDWAQSGWSIPILNKATGDWESIGSTQKIRLRRDERIILKTSNVPGNTPVIAVEIERYNILIGKGNSLQRKRDKRSVSITEEESPSKAPRTTERGRASASPEVVEVSPLRFKPAQSKSKWPSNQTVGEMIDKWSVYVLERRTHKRPVSVAFGLAFPGAVYVERTVRHHFKTLKDCPPAILSTWRKAHQNTPWMDFAGVGPDKVLPKAEGF
ncbi:hypothetical protein CALVIDRAFT_527379 [Calocera viscosa TUFC12733]|uniref:GRF-type domain-containing protein n=1 Tax=Calocera viscosa (strain TUFC12733) TaxID=1330018 RepID=A0A167MH21_CALVF|nr:hypothetical protein CALVIDRAFT_527379 [Calocera viscosa TUFC12733]